MNRRTFLSTAAALTANAQSKPFPIIDAHIHLFDPTRPQGVPWPTKNDVALYKPALPGRYRKIAEPFGVVGAIEVECSPLLEDNQWVLDIAAKNPIIVGTIGNLEPGKPEFRSQLDRFHRNPLFRGIRCGNLWGRDLAADVSKPEFIAGLKALAQAGLTLDTANQNAAMLDAVLKITDKVPTLRVVIDHLPQLQPLPDLKEFAKRPQVYVKVTEVLRRENNRVSADLQTYKDALDRIWTAFGEDRVLYGSDWPNSDQWAPYNVELSVVREYFESKGRAASEKYFWKNSVAAYRWVKRDTRQPA